MTARFCYNCGGDLKADKSGKLIFRMWTDPQGHEHPMHLTCHESVAGVSITAQPKGDLQLDGTLRAFGGTDE